MVVVPAVKTESVIEPVDMTVAENVSVPETAAVLARDRVKVEVFWPETMVAPRAMPVPEMYQPLQLTGVTTLVVIVYCPTVPEAAVAVAIVGDRMTVPETTSVLAMDKVKPVVP